MEIKVSENKYILGHFMRKLVLSFVFLNQNAFSAHWKKWEACVKYYNLFLLILFMSRI